jgi:predicted aspartyl protease
MVVDTGAAATIVPPQVLFDIGCDPEKSGQRLPIITASHFFFLPAVVVPTITGLQVTVENLEVVCHELPAETTVQGLLGLDFLRQVPAFQQFEKKILELTHP